VQGTLEWSQYDMTLYEPRRVVTANDAAGRSFVLSDASTPHVLSTGPGRGLMDLWASTPDGPTRDGDDGVIEPIRLEPPAQGTVLRFFQVAPASAQNSAEAESLAAAAFAAMGASHVRVNTARHPGMHLSHTLDYVVVLKGELKLLLDEGEVLLKPYDVVIQRATNHAWVNLTDEPALCAAVLIDRSRVSAE
jgi:hypothetical protein